MAIQKKGKKGELAKTKAASKTASEFKKAKLSVPKAPYKRTELWRVLAEQSELSKKEVGRVMEALKSIATVHLVKDGPGQFTLPGLLKMTAKTKPATKARAGINPFTGQEIIMKAKPARRVVKARILRKFIQAFE